MTGVVVTIGTADTSTGIGGGSTMTIGAAPAGRGVVVGLPSAIGIRSVIESEIVILTADKFFFPSFIAKTMRLYAFPLYLLAPRREPN